MATVQSPRELVQLCFLNPQSTNLTLWKLILRLLL